VHATKGGSSGAGWLIYHCKHLEPVFRSLDLDEFDAAHAPVEVCMGGRCCHPEHLSKKTTPKNRSSDRVGTGLNGPRKRRPDQ
jgi:hypothetical protein